MNLQYIFTKRQVADGLIKALINNRFTAFWSEVRLEKSLESQQ